MTTPIVILSGPAGSGKDTAAGMFRDHGAVCIAQADPMKRLVKRLYGLSVDSLWGPSERRQEVAKYSEWDGDFVDQWLKDVLGDWDTDTLSSARFQLRNWFDSMPDGVTARRLLQTLGTEWGREFSRNLWVDYAHRAASEILGAGCRYSAHAGVGYPCDRQAELVVITDGRFRNEILATKKIGGAAIQIKPAQVEEVQGGVAGHASEAEMNTIPAWWFDFVIENDKAAGLASLNAAVNDVARWIKEGV